MAMTISMANKKTIKNFVTLCLRGKNKNFAAFAVKFLESKN